jgi:outer membrane usher protein
VTSAPLRAGLRAIALILGSSCAAAGEFAPQDGKTVEFNPAFLPGGPAMHIDLSRYSRRNPVMPGIYDADVWLNGEWQARRGVRFIATDAGSDAMPCVSSATLASFGVSVASEVATEGSLCRPLSDYVPAATTRFDISEQRLDIEVPQALLARRRPGLVPREQRDAGIVSGQLGWRLNLHRSTTGSRSRMARFLTHEAGINAGNWRLRGAGSFSASHYRRRHLYVERQIETWRAQWRLGELMVADGSFAPVRMRGMTLASDARMDDDAGIGYKPTVRGVARTHARLRVTQGGLLLRELSVPPGPFVIDDLQGLARGGDLVVTVDEEDGGRTSFRVPFFAMPELLGENHTVVAMSVGRAVTTQRDGDGDAVLQTTWRRGFPRDTTLYGGWRSWGRGRSALVGGAMDTLAGAFAVDFMGSRTAARTRTWRLRHGRRWSESTSMWVSLVRERSGTVSSKTGRRFAADRIDGAQDRLDIMFQRELSLDRGVLTANASRRRVRRERASPQAIPGTSFALAWTRSWRRATLDVSLRHAVGDKSARIGISIPLGVAPSAPLLTVAGHGNRDETGRLQLGVMGATGPDGEVGYGASLAKGAHGDRRLGISASYLSGAGESSLAVDRATGVHTESLSTSGALIFHRNGITQAQRLGEAMALVHAADASGARLPSVAAARLDRRGYGVMPYLSPFRWNAVEIDPTGMSLDVSLSSTRRRVAPTAGALVLVSFDTEVGRTSLLVARRADGSPPRFGADVLDGQNRSVGVVGQAGNIFVRDVTPGSVLTIRWGDRAEDRCVVRAEGSGDAARGLTRLMGVCE